MIGVNIVRLTLIRLIRHEVIDAFRDVQAAEQEKDTLEKQADAYANQALLRPVGRLLNWYRRLKDIRARVVNERKVRPLDLFPFTKSM